MATFDFKGGCADLILQQVETRILIWTFLSAYPVSIEFVICRSHFLPPSQHGSDTSATIRRTSSSRSLLLKFSRWSNERLETDLRARSLRSLAASAQPQR